MALFDWNDRYSVGVGEMDAQHRKLIGLLNQLHQAMLDAQGKEMLEALLAGLARYTVEHFASEERMMQAAGFPDLLSHRAEHGKLTSEVLRFQAEYRAGNIALTVPLLQFLRTWLKGHILDSDMQYSPYVNRTAAR